MGLVRFFRGMTRAGNRFCYNAGVGIGEALWSCHRINGKVLRVTAWGVA